MLTNIDQNVVEHIVKHFEYFESRALQKFANTVDLNKCCKMSIRLQNSSRYSLERSLKYLTFAYVFIPRFRDTNITYQYPYLLLASQTL